MVLVRLEAKRVEPAGLGAQELRCKTGKGIASERFGENVGNIIRCGNMFDVELAGVDEVPTLPVLASKRRRAPFGDRVANCENGAAVVNEEVGAVDGEAEFGKNASDPLSFDQCSMS